MVDDVAKLEGFDTRLEDARKAITNLENGIKKLNEDLVNRVETSVMEAKHQEIVKELEDVREKCHYSFVKTEPEHDMFESIEKIELMRAALGSCLLRNEEMSQTVGNIAKDMVAMQRDIANWSLHSIPEIVVDLPDEVSELEPGEIPQCSCKRKRR